MLDLGAETADPVDKVRRPGLHELDLLALLQRAVDHAHQNDDAQIRVIPRIDQHRLQRRIHVALGRRHLLHDRFQDLGNADPRLGGGQHRLRRVEADHVLNLLLHLFRLGGRQVDLVDDRHDLVIMLDRLVHIGQRLRLDALCGVHHQQRALARGQAAAHLIGEVDMARRVHQVQRVGLAVRRGIGQAHRLRLDGDAALLLDLHIVEHLFRHLAVGQAARLLDQAIGQRRLAMVDMRDDRKVADLVERSGHGGRGLPG